MNVSKNILENKILKNLSLYHAVGEVKLLKLILPNDDEANYDEYMIAIRNLYSKGLIEIVDDTTNSMSVIRLKYNYH